MIFTTVALLPVSVSAARAADKPDQSQSRPTTGDTSAPAPDNSKVNVNQNGEKGLSAEQSGNSETDVKLTQKIRQALVKDKKLSTYAHNVKIIADGGQVVLKGPVKSQSEKEMVESKAGQIAGNEHVKSELEVVAK